MDFPGHEVMERHSACKLPLAMSFKTEEKNEIPVFDFDGTDTATVSHVLRALYRSAAMWPKEPL